MSEPAPFVLTLMLDPEAQRRFDCLRTAHFPSHRLVVGAHVTLFHALPNDLDVAAAVAVETTAQTCFPVQVTGLRSLGHGVAFTLESGSLREMRERLCRLWMPRLTPQDRQRWNPHLTIQNKVEPAVAQALHARLQAEFVPYEVMATGMALWIYRGGPWEAAGNFPFAA